ncbi:hypothetical protein H8S45_05580 [Agathobaculum sp. NSJ-28]|uniref:Uncharacterized protein n=2 Tax=Agathobaculum TaxID=2048137 RepID=A0A923LTN8_9FIRM|nr:MULTISPECIES: hypothetical protein [Butyricicoccaceae]MBS6882660.1 hypothetical protein [Clostridiaceae bacterium]SCI71343.1 Uncharacterised protein [uncultured Butyricicoccus sp.]MBC5724929.1 hypothetical protein [Agathobaculum faecis]MCU6788372.1 hypothetical protein [Agathobaculum ammoniilyticum]WOC76619.1 hypothetical protein RX717_06505 [Intestinibacillus sp. NTUH-41-i26]
MEKKCKTCKHYRPHYVKIKGCGFRRTRGGHCTYPRGKLRYEDKAACANYQPAQTEQ